MVFLHIFGALCEKNGESKSAVAKACGLSNSTVTKWKKTQAVPESSTLMKIAEHFGVTVDYLLGSTPESYLLGTEYQLKEAEKAYDKETNPDKRDELGGLIDVLRDSVEDQKLAISAAKMPVTETGNGRKEMPVNINDFLRAFSSLPEEDQKGLARIVELYRNTGSAASQTIALLVSLLENQQPPSQD